MDDLSPSLFAEEYATTSLKGCSLFSIESGMEIGSILYPRDRVVNPPLLAIQPSNHPLIYYSSHPLGFYCCDFRMEKATAIGKRQVPLSCFCRVPDDAYHYLVSRNGSLEVIDIRNPDVSELRWRYEGTMKSLRCLRTSSGEDSSYHILPSPLPPPSLTRRLPNDTQRRLPSLRSLLHSLRLFSPA